jgi:hypothetical protein
MSSRKLFCAVSLLAVLGTMTETAAGGRAIECYERTRTSPVYDTVIENVEVNPGFTRVDTVPAIVGTRTREVLVRPGRIKYRTVPALYAYETERVLVEPARIVRRVVAGIAETRYRTVKVADGGYSWEWRWIAGRKVLCKVKHKAHYERVAYTVHGQACYVRVTLPARYEYRKHKVLVEPERSESYVLEPEYETVEEQVVIQPELSRTVEVAPSYQRVARRVLVDEGSQGWRRVHIRQHCGG